MMAERTNKMLAILGDPIELHHSDLLIDSSWTPAVTHLSPSINPLALLVLWR